MYKRQTAITLYHKLADERRQAILQAQKIQQLLDSPPPEQKGISSVSYTHLAFPSKCVKSSHSIEESCSPSGCLSFKNCPLPSEKKGRSALITSAFNH